MGGHHARQASLFLDSLLNPACAPSQKLLEKIFQELEGERGDTQGIGSRIRLTVICSLCKLHKPVIRLRCRHWVCSDCIIKLSYEMTQNSLEGIERIACCERPLPPPLIFEAFGSERNFEVFKTTRTEKKVCPIDGLEHIADYMFTLSCGHVFFIDNLIEYINFTAISQGALSIKCPLPNCKIEVTHSDVERCIPPRDFVKFESFKIKEVGVKCPWCEYEYIPEDDFNGECISCKKSCIKCRQIHSSDSPCQRDNFQIGDNVKRCPQCGNGVVKESGCNFLRCAWANCKPKCYFCNICMRQLEVLSTQPSDHFSHFPEGPFGDICKGM
mmetsp:Transcript_6426/g.11190  ORF Transcript_6426/g.11190 Transcript_6426/m.11190 type:complete len:328 (+) Transcript_6426:2814-3797(+)